jgi:transportin-3
VATHHHHQLYKMLCTPGQAWQVMESCLLLMKAVASKISKEESNLLPIAIPVLLSFPPNDTHYAIRATTLELIGELAHWIGNHPDLIPDTLRFIQEAFNVPVLASAAASAVQSLCVNCKGQLIHLFDGLVSIIDAADNLNMSNNAIVGLMTGSIQLLDGLPADQISSGMNRLCIPPGQRLNQILQQNGVIKSNTLSDPALWMDRIAAVFRTCEYIVKENESHPGLPTATQLWPVLCNTLDKYRSDQRIVERTSRCFRFILRCLRSHAAPLITPLVNLVIYHHHIPSHHTSCDVCSV